MRKGKVISMAVAKSYENWEIVGDVFTDEAGKEWVRVRHSCPRCGGTGNYSFNMMYGSTCFRCGGSGKESKNVLAWTHIMKRKLPSARLLV